MAHKWMFVAFVAPMSWALVNIIDMWLSVDMFNDEEEATAVIGLFGILPLLSMFIWGVPQMNLVYSSLAVIAGILFMVFTYYYFRSLYLSGDLTLISILLNLSGLVVPMLAIVLVQEHLTGMKYVGILVVVIGSATACFDSKAIVVGKVKAIAFPMAIAIVAFSLSMVIEEKVYSQIGFHSGFMFFSFGLLLGGIFCYLKKSIRERRFFRVSALGYTSFVVAECINLIAIAFSHYAIKISPSVSYVAVIETTVPAFVMLFCLSAYRLCRTFGVNNKYQNILGVQLTGYEYKSLAIVIMAFGIYIIYLPG